MTAPDLGPANYPTESPAVDLDALDPLAHVKVGDPEPLECIEGQWACDEPGPMDAYCCTRDPDHPGQHIACANGVGKVLAVWTSGDDS